MAFTRVAIAGLACALAALPVVAADNWPDKPIRVIVSVPAGGTPDLTARLIAPAVSSQLGQPLVIDNRGGASGSIGAELAANAAPDGYTLLISSPGAIAILPHLRKVPYDTLKDFAPVGLISSGPFLLLTHPSLPVRSVKDLLGLARSQPGKLNYSSAGTGAPNHLAMELFKSMTGVNIVHVPYKGAPQAVADLVAGQVPIGFNSILPMMPHLKASRLRALGVASQKRSSQLPDVPTISEAGVPGFEAANWFGMLAPVKTPRRILARVSEALVKAVRSPEIQSKFIALGADPVGSSPAEFARFIRVETEKYAKVIRISGARLD